MMRGSLADGWDSSRIECERVVKSIHREHSEGMYAGVLPVVVVTLGADFASFHHFVEVED